MSQITDTPTVKDMFSRAPIHPEPPTTPQIESGERERKRRRKALSCYDCRRRKLRCDRNFPSCSRCSKAGLASSCHYETGPSESKNGQEDSVTDVDDENSRVRPQVSNGDGVPSTFKQLASEPPSTGSQKRKISQLENRIANLEETLANQSSTAIRRRPFEASNPRIESRNQVLGVKPDLLRYSAEEPETMIFRKGDFKTQYFGATSETAQVAGNFFPEFFKFVKDPNTDHSSVMRVRKEMSVLKGRRKAERAASLSRIDGDLFKLLPSREEADKLIRQYFDTFETTYRVLHQPTFWDEYRQFWIEPKAHPTFVALILLTMAIVRCVSNKQPTQYVGDSTKERETAILHISACDFWLHSQSIKHATIHHFQVHTLLIIAKLTNLMKEKQMWTCTGTSLRHFMSAGLHRDPDSVLGGKISEFQKEMRRRLWTTMAELELEASISRGMPTALAGLRIDCGNPKNINDQDMNAMSAEIPSHRPLSEHTSTSFLCHSQTSFSLRNALVSAVNSSNLPLLYDDVLLYEEKIMQQLELVPRWSKEIPSAALLEAVLDIQLRQFLIILHGPYARRSDSNPQCGYSRMVCFNAASSIIEQHSKLSETGDLTLSVLRHDVYRAAMCLCQNVYMSSFIPNNPSNNILCASSTQLIERALKLLEQRAMILGRGYIYFVFLSGGYGLTLSKTSDRPIAALKQDTVDRVVALFEKVSRSQCEGFRPILISDGQSQTPPQSNASGTGSTPIDIQGMPGVAEMPYYGVQLPFSANQGLDQQFFDLGYDLPGWNMEDFWSFDPNINMG